MNLWELKSNGKKERENSLAYCATTAELREGVSEESDISKKKEP